MAAAAGTKLTDPAQLAKLDVKQLTQYAKLAENAERYKDMCTFMKECTKRSYAYLNAADKPEKQAAEMNTEQRNYLSVAYKNVISEKRKAFRNIRKALGEDDDAVKDKDRDTEVENEAKKMLNAMGDDTDGFNLELAKKLAGEYKKYILADLRYHCKEVLALLAAGPNKSHELFGVKRDSEAEQSTRAEDVVFYLKMSGDYNRYLSECVEGEKAKSKEALAASQFYTKAMAVAKEHLTETHPTRLGLALNFSVCYYEILGNPTEAKKLAKEAFDDAIEKLDNLNDNSYKDSTLIMQLLRDNLALWTSDDQEQDEQ